MRKKIQDPGVWKGCLSFQPPAIVFLTFIFISIPAGVPPFLDRGERVMAASGETYLTITARGRMDLSIAWGERITGTIIGKGDAIYPLSSSTGLVAWSNIPEGFTLQVNSDSNFFYDGEGALTDKPSQDLEVYVDPRIGWVKVTKEATPLTQAITRIGRNDFTANYRITISWHDRGLFCLNLIYTLVSLGS